jgi:radical SAM superfamily enzyme YgiQ (UPF0313 family)
MIVTIPIGLLYLASFIKKNDPDIRVEIRDPDIFNGSFDEFIHTFSEGNPDIIGISVFSHVMEPAKKMVSKLKSAVPGAILISGGSHINGIREKILRQMPEVDYAIYGEGETGLLEFCRQISSKGAILDPDNIPGLVFRNNSTITYTPNSYSENLDNFDPIDFNLIDIDRYFSFGSPMGLFRRGEHVAQIITTRGCPFSCTFCASPVNMGKKVRNRSTDKIIDEIESLVSLGADEIHVMDDNFTFDRDHVINLCRKIVSKGFDLRFCMPNGVRLDKLDEEMLIWMKRAGWYHLGFGIEVGSDEALRKVRKGITIRKIKEKIDMVKKTGFTTTGFFIIGLPHDNIGSIRKTASAPDMLGLDMASFGNFTPLPGTRLYDELTERGEIAENYVPSFSSGEVTYSPPGITAQQLVKLQRNIVLKYWLHPRRIRLILSLLKFRDIKYVLRRLYLIVFRPRIVKNTT